MTVIIASDVPVSNPNLPFLQRDSYLYGANEAAHLFDIGRKYSYPRQGKPVNLDVIRDLALNSSDGSVIIPSGSSISFAAGGFNFTNALASPAGVVMPGNPLSKLTSAQNFMLTVYIRVPDQTDWLTGNGPMHVFVGDSVNQSQATERQLAQMAFVATTNGPYMWLRRQTAVGQNFDTLYFQTDTLPFGEVAQISLWRTAEGLFGRIRSASKNVTRSAARGANNSATLSDRQILVGRASVTSSTARPSTYTIYRSMIEDLAVSGRDPLSALDADYARNIVGSNFRS